MGCSFSTPTVLFDVDTCMATSLAACDSPVRGSTLALHLDLPAFALGFQVPAFLWVHTFPSLFGFTFAFLSSASWFCFDLSCSNLDSFPTLGPFRIPFLPFTIRCFRSPLSLSYQNKSKYLVYNFK